MSFNLLGGQDPRSFFQVLIFTQHVNNLPANCLSTGDRRHPVRAKIPKTKGPEHYIVRLITECNSIQGLFI